MLNAMNERLKNSRVVGMFFDKSFFHYTWVSILFSVVNIFLLWLFIDVFLVHTIIASTIVIGGTFILRYVFFRVFKIM